MGDFAVLITRLQITEMNNGYRSMIEALRKKHDQVMIIVGESPLPGSIANPLSVEARKAVLRDAFPDVRVRSLKDHPLDEEWSRCLDSVVADAAGKNSVLLYGSQERFIHHYEGVYPTSAVAGQADADDDTPDEQPTDKRFREGVVFGLRNKYPSVFPTVDIAVFRDSKKRLLMGKKNSDRKWRLIGGFADPEDNGFEAAAMRELKEECGDISVTQLTYERSFAIDDWRYRYEKDKIITTLFSTEFVDGDIHASDDIADVAWFELQEVEKMVRNGESAAEHRVMLNFLLEKYR